MISFQLPFCIHAEVPNSLHSQHGDAGFICSLEAFTLPSSFLSLF